MIYKIVVLIKFSIKMHKIFRINKNIKNNKIIIFRIIIDKINYFKTIKKIKNFNLIKMKFSQLNK